MKNQCLSSKPGLIAYERTVQSFIAVLREKFNLGIIGNDI